MLSGQAEALGSTLLRPTVALVSMTRKHKKTPKLTRTAISSRQTRFVGVAIVIAPCFVRVRDKKIIFIFSF